ncbi:MAG: radical SAM protein [Deltaproteobacteria bacterium]|nr:radical SAM protein [Deltaproteobacteria bacterium]
MTPLPRDATTALVFVPEAILIERGCENAPMVRRCRARVPEVPVTIIDDRRALRGGDFAAAKRRLLLAPWRGTFLEHCPAGTRGMACCNYLVLTFASNCPMDCRYCFLQEYLADNPALTAYVNPETALAEVGRLLDRHPERQFRIGTGELADSLALDPLTGLSRELVPFFAARRNALLELKTKTDAVDDLVTLDPQGRVVVSWSLAPAAAVQVAEIGTTPVGARLAAMRRVAAAGYKVGVHLDPLVEHAGWEEGYRDLLHEIAVAVPVARLAWVSMGALRLSPALRTVMRARFPATPLLAGEQVAGVDGKWRDFQPLRVRMYRTVRGFVEAALPRVPLYLCMETPDVWERVFGVPPAREQALGALLAAR